MNWGARRQRVIIVLLAAIAVALIAVVIIASVYHAPSCMDNKQNQGEAGVDCGGPCPYLCSVDEYAPKILFVRPVSPQQGRTDIIAYIQNQNTDAGAGGASYTVDLYDANGAVVATHSGTITLYPGTTLPLYLPNVYNGSTPIAQAFLTIDPASLKWQRTTSKPVEPIPSNIQEQNTQLPKITATLTNPTAEDFDEETVVATVFDKNDKVIAASQTVIPVLPAQGSAGVVFTWNTPFTSPPARVEILPAISI